MLRQSITLLHSLHSICVCISRLFRLIMKMLFRDSAQAKISSISDTMNYHSSKERLYCDWDRIEVLSVSRMKGDSPLFLSLGLMRC